MTHAYRTSAMRSISLAAAAAVLLVPVGAGAQSQNQTTQDRLGAVVGALFGVNSPLDPQWLRGQRALANGRSQFESRLSADVRAGALTNSQATRLRADYDALVQQEATYSAGGFSTQERADLNARYSALTQTVEAGGGEDLADRGASVAEGRADFEARVTAAVSARRLTRAEGTRLRTDYANLVQTEANYSRDGLSTRERDDLEAQLDALDARVGDGPSASGSAPVTLDPRTRLANIETAVGAAERSGAITRAEAADIRVEHGDLVRLEAAYAAGRPSSDDSAYLVRRLGELETRARVQTRR